MKKYTTFDLDKEVTDLEGKPVRLQVTETEFINITVRNAFRKALGAIFSDEAQSITFEQKMERYNLAQKIWQAELSIELKTEEQALLKKCVGKLYSGETLGFLENIIENTQTIEHSNGQEKRQPAKAK